MKTLPGTFIADDVKRMKCYSRKLGTLIRPEPLMDITRLKMAWDVLTGKADALYWSLEFKD